MVTLWLYRCGLLTAVLWLKIFCSAFKCAQAFAEGDKIEILFAIFDLAQTLCRVLVDRKLGRGLLGAGLLAWLHGLPGIVEIRFVVLALRCGGNPPFLAASRRVARRKTATRRNRA